MTRIIAGRARGIRLLAPKGERTRPTTDRTKEALFSAIVSWLGTTDRPANDQLSGFQVLDLYAGSGAIALEAVSRGAGAVAVESDRVAAALILSNAKTAHLDAEVKSMKTTSFLATSPREFDLVFADPPYALSSEEIEADLARLLQGWLAADALVVIERSKRSEAFAWPERFAKTWTRGYGEAKLYFGTVQPMEE